MTESFIQTLSLLVVVLVALLGGFWQFVKKAGDNKTRYQQDVISMRSIIISSELVPQIVQLIEKVEAERGQRGSRDIEQILSKSSFAYTMQYIARTMGKINEIDNLYLVTIRLAFTCAYDLLLASVIPAVSIIWLFVDRYWEHFIPLVIFSGLIIVFKIIVDILRYTRNIGRFIEKDNEIRLGRSVV